MQHASLCTGIGACELAASWMGWENAFSCEINPFCQRVLKYYYPKSKHYGNIFETDFSEWRGKIDILTAGFPCQPFSVAGQRKGSDDDRYIWPEVLRAIGEIRPTWFIGENVAGITSMVLPSDEIEMESYTDVFGESYVKSEMREQFVVERICQDLESIGYFVQPIIIPACAVEAPHRRDRIWFIAHTNGNGRSQDAKQKSSEKREDEKQLRRSFEIKYVANSNELNGNISGFRASELSQQQTPGIWVDRDSYIQRRKEYYITGKPEKSEFSSCVCEKIPGWGNFPTQSPVCCGNDGLSSELSGITFSKHRAESIKAYGNSMVPQVVLEIFKAIEKLENNPHFK